MTSSKRYISKKSHRPPVPVLPPIQKSALSRFISGAIASSISLSLFTSSLSYAAQEAEQPVLEQDSAVEEDSLSLVENTAAKGVNTSESPEAMPTEGNATIEEAPTIAEESIEYAAAEEIEGDDSILEEVMVTGIRASQRGAIDLKKQAGTMVDAIVAEDVSKFPDKNVTEALQRVTGVQITRDFGEGSGVNIRGMQAGLNRIEFDGVTALGDGGRGVSLTDTASELVKSLTVVKGSEARITEGGIGGTVQVEMRKPNDFDEHFFRTSLENIYNDLAQANSPRANVTGVYKFNEDMGVMMNLNWFDRTTMIHALRNTSWSRFADYDNSPEKTVDDPEFAHVASYEGCTEAYGLNAPQFDENNNPILDDSGNQVRGNSTRLQDCQRQWWEFGPVTPRYGNWSRVETRVSANIGYGWDVTDKLSFFTDYTFNERDRRATDYNLQLGTGSEERIDRESVLVDENHNIRALTTANTGYTNRTLKFDWLSQRHLFKLGGNYSGDKIEVGGIVAYSETNNDIDSRDINVGALQTAGIRLVMDEQGAPEFDLTSAYRYQSPDSEEAVPFEPLNVNDPSIYNGRIEYKYAPIEQIQREDSAKIDFTYNFDEGKFFTQAHTGFRYEMRSLDGQSFDSRISFDVRNDDFTQEQMTELLTGRMEAVPRFFPNIDLGVGTIESYAAVDPEQIIPAIEALAQRGINRRDLPPRNGAYAIEENSFAGYLQLNFERSIGDMLLSGNFGVRVIQTESSSEGDIVITSNYDSINNEAIVWDWDRVPNSPINTDAERPYTRDDVVNENDDYNQIFSERTFEGRDSIENEYTDILPSLNLNLELIPEELVLFFGMAKVMARPGIGVLNVNANCTRRANIQAEIEEIPNRCTAGNPTIDPYRATQFDLALNWYPNEDSIFGATYFEKELTSFIEGGFTNRDVDFFSGELS